MRDNKIKEFRILFIARLLMWTKGSIYKVIGTMVPKQSLSGTL